MKQNKGITLIALVITIIVLLILAGVVIVTLTEENGILTRANEATEKTKNSNLEEQVQLAIIGSKNINGTIDTEKLNKELENIEDLLYNNDKISEDNKINKLPVIIELGGNEKGILENGEILDVTTINEIKNKMYVEQTTLIKDENNKILILPKGFKIIVNENTSNASRVEQGIVIQDKEGNEFVWIPVDEKLNNEIDLNKIQLGRYIFDSTSGIPSIFSWSYTEDTVENHNIQYSNAIARDINDFIRSVLKNGGFYIGRFEASYGTNGKVSVKQSNSIRLEKNINLENGMLWNYITQTQASQICKDLYNTDQYKSDLMNSYAWDTTIMFLQKNDDRNNKEKIYSIQNSLNNNLMNTGTTGDKICNIFDMSSNCIEWTTETKPDINNSATARGGTYYRSNYTTSIRYYSRADNLGPNISFRPILYLN